MYQYMMGCSYRLTRMRTNTSTGTKSSAPGTESSLAKLRRFMMVEHMRRMHWTLSRGVLYALMVLISDWAEGQGASFKYTYKRGRGDSHYQNNIKINVCFLSFVEKIPLGFEELCDWLLQPWRVAGCVHGTTCVGGKNRTPQLHSDMETM